MLIRSEFDIQFQLPAPTAVIALMRLHWSLDTALVEPESIRIEYTSGETKCELLRDEYLDGFGNRCFRLRVPAGEIRFSGSSLVRVNGDFDEAGPDAAQQPVENLPYDVLPFLLSSRYCELDRLTQIACDLFSSVPEGWERVIAIRDWVHNHVQFDYMTARSTKTALDVFTERVGVCRDFQHLAITMTRSMNVPARYVTGYLGDIRVPYGGPGDFSAWYEVYLGGRWWTMDARHNVPRIGRLLMATGRDATDVAITTSFGSAILKHFSVESHEVDESGEKVPLPVALMTPVVEAPAAELATPLNPLL